MTARNTSWVALAVVALLISACSQSETPEQCVQRFAKNYPSDAFFDSGSWRSTLVYRLPDDFSILETKPGNGEDNRGKGPRVTIA